MHLCVSKLRDSRNDSNTGVSINSWLTICAQNVKEFSHWWPRLNEMHNNKTCWLGWILYGRQHVDGEQVVSECSCGGTLPCAEILDCSVINGRGRAPLIVVPDTGTRPQTKQDRPGAGCHAQSPSSRKPECCSGGFGGKRGHLVMTVEESSRRDSSI